MVRFENYSPRFNTKFNKLYAGLERYISSGDTDGAIETLTSVVSLIDRLERPFEGTDTAPYVKTKLTAYRVLVDLFVNLNSFVTPVVQDDEEKRIINILYSLKKRAGEESDSEVRENTTNLLQTLKEQKTIKEFCLAFLKDYIQTVKDYSQKVGNTRKDMSQELEETKGTLESIKNF